MGCGASNGNEGTDEPGVTKVKENTKI